MIGRVAFPVASGQAKPEEILLLAYGKKAALELQERLESKLGIKGVTADSFHRLDRCIVKATENETIAISDMAGDDDLTTNFVDRVFKAKQQEPEYRELLLNYFERWLHAALNPFDFETLWGLLPIP